MKTSLHCDGRVLVVGDGDFSFTVSLMKHSNLQPEQVYTSNLETETSILHHVQASQNMASLKELGVSVFLETDARDLHNHKVISKEQFDRIVFNFPLADRHNIKKNRSLLADFFLSCKSVLTIKGQILVTLCKGQGGTPADRPIRSWHDSWQIVAMATDAGFFLHEVLPFDPSEFPEYHSVGFRFQDKSFNVTGALTHVFEEGQVVEAMEDNARGMLVHDGQLYSCSGYVASTFKRNLLEEPKNPLCILRQILEEKLKRNEATGTFGLVIDNGCSPIVPSHKSTIFVDNKKEINDDSGVNSTQTDDDTKSDKDWKNCENLKIMNKVHLVHGVAGKHAERDTTGDWGFDDARYSSSLCLPTASENVFILVKRKSGVTHEDLLSDRNWSEELGRPSVEGNECDDTSTSDCAESQGKKNATNDGNHLSSHEESSSVGANSLSPVYHCRSSLLEDLTHLCQVFGDQNTVDVSGNCVPCVVTSSRCMVPCPITEVTLPTKHEMLILHPLTSSNSFSQEAEVSTNRNHQHFDVISSKVLFLLQTLTSSCRKPDLSPQPNDSGNKINITGMDDAQFLTHLISQSNGESTNQVSIGYFLQCRIAECFYHATILNLDRLACYLYGIDNPRLMYSESEKFLCQFQGEISHCEYRPFNLYPMKFVHDLSFWEKCEDSGPFDSFSLFDTIRYVAGDIVVNVSLIDVYEEPDSKRRSRCYRLYFQSCDKCLSYVKSWKLQSRIRMEVARGLGVQLR